MNKQLLYTHLKKVNMSSKDRAEFIKALNGGNGSGDLYQRVSQIELSLSNVLEALKPVQLSGFPPIGNVTQEQLDEIGLTEKVINNIVTGYTNRIYINGQLYHIIFAEDGNVNLSFVFIRFYFDNNGAVYSCSQYRVIKDTDHFIIEVVEI